MQGFTFDAGFQRAVLRLAMIDDEFTHRALQWIRPEHFTSEPLGWIFGAIQEHWRTYQQRMTDLVLREYVRRLPPDRAMRYHHEAELVIALGNVPEHEYVKVQLRDFIQQAIFATAHQYSADLFNRGERSKAYDVMARAQDQIRDVTFESVDRVWLFDSLSDRQLERVREASSPYSSVVTTGIPQLDEMTDGGIHKGEVWAVLAYAKRCKTTWLVNQGFNATRVHHMPTVHFILEGKSGIIASRYDSCFSQELYSKVRRGEIDAQLYRYLAEEYREMRQLLVIRSLTSWDVTILDIQAELAYLKSQGMNPGMVIVDYMDLGRARDSVAGMSELQHQTSFGRDLKRLVDNEEVACWTAWQAQRPKPGAHTREHVISSANVADAYPKVRIVNSYGSLNATDDEMSRGEMRVFWEGHRDAAVNKLWTITNDLARMRMLTSAEEYVPASQQVA